MVIIYQKGEEFWIEVFFETRSNLTTANDRTTAHTLERSGVFLGGMVNLNVQIITTITSLSGMIRNTNNAELTFGQTLTTFNLTIRNDNAATANVGAIAIIFMRKNQ